MPKISVVIPVYNGEKTIQKTIESVLKQTWQDFELIVINDGSQDATLEILSSIQDPRLQILSYDNAGLASSRNRGIDQAQGEFISFLDADDLWTSDKLEAQFQALQEHPEAAVAYSWTDYIDQLSQFLHSGRHITINGNVYQHLLVNNFLENGSNPLIRKQALNQVGKFDTSLKAGEDWDMWLRLAVHYQFVAVPLPQILYRVSADSMSSQIKNQEIECLKVIEKAFKSAPES
ncbi:MAG: glycosyl transferase family A, partial [Oscillatoriales cyanobacterium CG2_30_40_61]